MTQPFGVGDIERRLPPVWPVDVLPQIAAMNRAAARKIVVLDDDPTGTQTVHGIPVLTTWSVDALTAELAGEHDAFYVLTNSRSLTPASARALAGDIGANLYAAAQRTNVAVVPISRSDSTLRGHFPVEVDALADALNLSAAPRLIAPAFFAGGRYTIDDVHYVAQGEVLTPAAETEFARDAVFGYRASNLRDWVQEKTAGAIQAADVRAISLLDIRQGGPERVAQLLRALPPSAVCVVNAAAERDLDVVALACALVEAEGCALLYRSAASLARARIGLAARPLLTRADLLDGDARSGGLIVVGSYVPKSSEQLARLLATGVSALEVRVDALLSEAARAGEIARVAAGADAHIAAGRNVAIYTSRALVTGADAAGSLAIGNTVSEGLVGIVRAIQARPRYLLAKGGITSSDVATKGLGIKRALVLGQLLPGVPVWRAGAESRFPGMAYIVFPGNVGGPDAVADAVAALRQ
jgi:uncharacterized protein YgbK (DUF1537 family)